jgi:IS66 Orf2 like protein
VIAVPPGVRILLATRPVDFRKGMDGLAVLVQQALRADPFAGDVFIFRLKRADRVTLRGLAPKRSFWPEAQLVRSLTRKAAAARTRGAWSGRRSRLGRSPSHVRFSCARGGMAGGPP